MADITLSTPYNVGKFTFNNMTVYRRVLGCIYIPIRKNIKTNLEGVRVSNRLARCYNGVE